MSNEFFIPEYDTYVTHVLRGCGILIATGIIYGHRRHAFQSSEHLSTESAVRHLRTRGRLIIAAASLLLVDQVNNIVFSVLLATGSDYGPPLYITHRVVYMLSMLVTGPILCMTNLLRCAVIILDDPLFRTRFLRWAVAICAILLLATAIGAGWAIYDLATTPSVTRWTWIIAHYVPVWATVPMGLFPLMIIVGSIWSLMSVARQGSQPVSIVASHDSAGTGHSSQVVPPPQSLGRDKRQSTSSLSLSHNKAVGNGHASLGRIVQAALQIGHGQKTKSSKKILYPLSTTFLTLTILLTLEWAAVLFLGINSSILGLKTNATISVLGLIALLTEASFGKLMRVASSKRRGRMKEDFTAVGTVKTAVLDSQLAHAAHFSGSHQQQQSDSTSNIEVMSMVQDLVPQGSGKGMRRSSTAEMWGRFRDPKLSFHSKVRRPSHLIAEPALSIPPPQP